MVAAEPHLFYAELSRLARPPSSLDFGWRRRFQKRGFAGEDLRCRGRLASYPAPQVVARAGVAIMRCYFIRGNGPKPPRSEPDESIVTRDNCRRQPH
jgi:hypothetical protein